MGNLNWKLLPTGGPNHMVLAMKPEGKTLGKGVLGPLRYNALAVEFQVTQEKATATRVQRQRWPTGQGAAMRVEQMTCA